jgi:hypothetical protein
MSEQSAIDRPKGQVVESSISYLGDCAGKPIFYGRQRELNNLPLTSKPVRVEDGRPIRGEVSLDREGFVLADHRTAVTNFFDREQVRTVYMPELEALLKDLTGAAKVVASAGGVLRRSERSPLFGKDGSTVPARFAHCDYSQNPAGSTFWTDKLLAPDELEARRGKRIAIYNLWRPLSDPPQDAPLGVCDARTVRMGDRVWSDCVIDPPGAPELKFENSVFRHSPGHRWCYFRDMTQDEVLVFKGYDSDRDRATGVPHSAFDDPSCPADAPPRASIDVRAFAFFD